MFFYKNKTRKKQNDCFEVNTLKEYNLIKYIIPK